MDGKKTFEIKINGIDKSLKDVTTLREALNGLSDDTKKANQANTQASAEQERAERQLASTIDRVVKARTDANRAQIDASNAAREANRQVQLEQKMMNATTNSIEEMRAKLSLMKMEWKNMDVDSEAFQKATEDIKKLNDEIKNAEQATGNFSRNVGNYEGAVATLSAKLETMTKGLQVSRLATSGLQSALGGLASGMTAFGDDSEETSERVEGLRKVMGLLGVAQNLNNGLLGVSSAMHRTNAAAINTGSVSLKGFSKALIATGIGAFIVLLGAMIAYWDDIKKAISNLIPGVGDLGKAFDDFKAVLAGVGKAVVDFIIMPFKAIAKIFSNIKDLGIKHAFDGVVDEMKQGLDVVGNYQKGYLNQVAKNNESYAKAERKRRAKELEEFIKDKEAQLGAEWKYSEEGRKAYQSLYDAKRKMYEDDKKNLRELQREEWRHIADLKKQDDTLAKQQADQAKRQADQAKADAEKKAQALKQALDTERELIRKAEDDITSLTADEFEKRRKEIDIRYSRQREDLRRQLYTDKTLTEKGKGAIRQMLSNIDKHISEEKKKVNADEIKAEEAKQKAILDIQRRYANLAVKEVEMQFADIQQLQEKAVTKKPFGIIDVEATRQNLAQADQAISQYIQALTSAQGKVRKSNKATLDSLKEGTIEHAEELQKQQQAEQAFSKKIEELNKQRAGINKDSAELVKEYWKDVFDVLQENANLTMNSIGQIFDASNAIFNAQLDELNSKYDEISKRYDDVEKQRKESTDRLKSYEQQIKDAQGGTAIALKEQMIDEIQNKNELEREEKRLAKEKEKREAQIAKKEKQLKKTKLMQDIAGALANVALGVTKALSMGLAGIPIAAIISASGAVQVGVMSKQLTKLEKGGKLKGKRHKDGGMKIEGSDIEVEGGEFVINRTSTTLNERLIEHINQSNHVVTYQEIAKMQGASTAPQIQIQDYRYADTKILEAIENINLQPKVSVVDIMDVQQNMANVNDISGIK